MNSTDNIIRIIKGTNFDYFSKGSKIIFLMKNFQSQTCLIEWELD